MLKSWKTTLCALLVTAGHLADKLQRHVVCPSWVGVAASLAFIVGIVGIGLLARDHDKTSEDHNLHR